MNDHGRAPADDPPRRPPGPLAGAATPAGDRWRAVRPGVRGVGVAIVVLGLAIGLGALTLGGDGARSGNAGHDPLSGDAVVQIDPDQPEPARTEPGGRDQLLLLSALVTGTGVLVAGAATSARRARARRGAAGATRPAG